MINEFGANVSPEEFKQALDERRLVVKRVKGSGETDHYEVWIVQRDTYYLRRVIARGYKQKSETYPVRGMNFNKAWHVVETIAASLGLGYEVQQTYQEI